LRVEISPGWEIAISIIQVDAIPLPASGLDFCYLLDVLHLRSGERPTSCVVPYWPKRSGDRTDSVVACECAELGGGPSDLPLSRYRDESFYTLRPSAFDRFGIPIE